MDISEHHGSAVGIATPYDRIDIGWVERRLNEQTGVRRSRLSTYFEGVMEFVEEPPSLSRSPTPEVDGRRTWQAGKTYSRRVRPFLEHTKQRRSSGKGIPRLPSRRSTLESDSDTTTEIQHRRRRQVTPELPHKPSYCRVSQPLKQHTRPSRPSTSSKTLTGHKMETRSKSRRVLQPGYSGISKLRLQRRKVS